MEIPAVLSTPVAILGRCLLLMEKALNRAKVEGTLAKFKSVGKASKLDWPVKVYGAQHMSLGNRVHISWNSWLFCIERYADQRFKPQIIIEDEAYLGNGSHIVACRKVTIGANVMLGDYCYVSDNIHEYKDISLPISENRMKVPGEVYIGSGSWLGDHVCVFGDVHIGKHCIVGANSVVMCSIPDYSVAVGAPARIVKRYNVRTQMWCKTDKFGNFLEEEVLTLQ